MHQEDGSGTTRRSILKATSTGAAVGVGAIAFAGTASAHTAEARFCGCSRVCATGTAACYRVYSATETDGTFNCYTKDFDPGSDNCICVSQGDVQGEKIIAIEARSPDCSSCSGCEVICNPNRCARKAIASCESQGELNCTENSEAIVRTRRCSEPRLCGHP